MIFMIDKKKLEEDEKKIGELMDRINALVLEEVKDKPYLLVLSTLYEVDREGDKSKIAAQWNWRSNIDPRTEGRKESDIEAGKTMMRLLVEQLKDVSDRPKIGIKTHYKL